VFLYRTRGDDLSDIKEDLAFLKSSSREVDGIDPEDCVSTENSNRQFNKKLKNIYVRK